MSNEAYELTIRQLTDNIGDLVLQRNQASLDLVKANATIEKQSGAMVAQSETISKLQSELYQREAEIERLESNVVTLNDQIDRLENDLRQSIARDGV